MSSKTNTKTSLSYRLASRFTALVILSHVVAAVGLYIVLQRGVHQKDLKLVQARYQEMAVLLEQNDLPMLRHTLADDNDVLARVWNDKGELIFQRDPYDLSAFDARAVQDQALAARASLGFTSIKPRVIGEETIELLTSETPNHYRVVLGVATYDSEDFLHLFLQAAGVAVVLASLLSLLFGYLYAKHALAPVRSLIRTIQGVRKERTATLPPLTGPSDELAELTGLFNGMVTQINHLINSLQQSLDAIAHDLRTPLTHLLHRYETVVKSGAATVPRDWVLETFEETQRLAELVSTLLELSDAESRTTRIHKTDFDIGALLAECAELYEHVAEDRGATITVEGGDFAIRADRLRLKRAVANLIDNALKYSGDRARVQLTARRGTQGVVIRVSDNGRGIPEADHGKIWERLYRGDASRSSQGMGLGLSFVKSIVELHGGDVTVESAENRGTAFEITIPSNA